MAKIKTVKTDVDVMEFINSVPDERRRNDSLKLLEVISEVTGFEPYVWSKYYWVWQLSL